MAQDTQLLTGLIAIEAALAAGWRTVYQIHVDEGMDHRKVEPVRRLAKRLNVPLDHVSREQLDALCGDEKHGGAAAEVGPKRFIGLDELLVTPDRREPFIVMLDGIEDPYNFAHAVRALWAAGCTGLVVRPRNWFDAGPLIARASAGATELAPTAIAESPADAVTIFKANGLKVVAADEGKDAVDMHEADLGGPLLLLIGGEHRGIQRSVLDTADLTIRIPYGRPFPLSLGTVAAASALGFEVLRQQRGRRVTRRRS